MTKFCWICSKRFWSNIKYRIYDEDNGVYHLVHKSCGLGEGYKVEPYRDGDEDE